MPLPPDVVDPPTPAPSHSHWRATRRAHRNDSLALARRQKPDRRRPFLSLLILLVLIAVLAVPLALGLTALTRSAVGAGINASSGVHPQVPLVLPPLQQRSTIYAADGSVIDTIYQKYNRDVVPLRQINHVTRNAVLAIEDHGFYSHGALDVASIVRAFLANIRAGHVVQGGSTIAQQLVKNTVTGNEVTLSRKIQEAEDAIRLENTYTKDKILGMYLNDVYLGNSVYGVAAAAQFYFATKPSDLKLPEAATLAGIIQSPAQFDPIAHPNATVDRRNVVLTRMRALHWIGPAKYQKALHAPLRLYKRQRDQASILSGSFWEQYVINRFLADPTFGKTYHDRQHALFQGGLKIYTTLDPSFQTDAEQAIADKMSAIGQPQSALVSIEPDTGAVRAMAVGNSSFKEGDRYNLATDPGGGRTAGSAFKAFTLAAALEQGMSPNKVFNGTSPKTIPHCGGGENWHVQNAEPVSGGSFPLWLATADSVNVVFAQVIDQVGPKNVARVAHQMGITSNLTPVCPLTLGTSPVSPFEMTSAYSTLANNGVHCKPYSIGRVVGPTGDVIERAKPQCKRVMPAKIAQLETSMLEGVIKFGTASSAVTISRPAAGKTGTGQNYQDAWFLGYVPQLTTGVWVGYAKGEIPMPNVPGYGTGFGGTLAAPIWNEFMIQATRGMPVRNFHGIRSFGP
ncbi:MAG: transglycosylase domain-containing protein [Actinomycetota bacterium]|nr:transglycosylase domain-containing protein [Actinomycetota bacterium]